MSVKACDSCEVNAMKPKHLGTDRMSICGHTGVSLVADPEQATCKLCQDIASRPEMPISSNRQLNEVRMAIYDRLHGTSSVTPGISHSPASTPASGIPLKTRIRMLANRSLCANTYQRLNSIDALDEVTCNICRNLWQTKATSHPYDSGDLEELASLRRQFFAGPNETTAPSSRMVGITPVPHDISPCPASPVRSLPSRNWTTFWRSGSYVVHLGKYTGVKTQLRVTCAVCVSAILLLSAETGVR